MQTGQMLVIVIATQPFEVRREEALEVPVFIVDKRHGLFKWYTVQVYT